MVGTRSWSEQYVSASPTAAQIFAALDVDDSGFISIDELLFFGKECGAYWADWPASSVLELAGASGASAEVERLSSAEFEHFCEAAAPWGHGERARTFVLEGFKRRALLDPFDPALVEAAFSALDIDDVSASGYVELSELLHFSSEIGAGWSQAACEALLGRMDADGDLKISLSEFESFVRQVGLHGCQQEVAAFIQAGEERRKLIDPYDETKVRLAFRALDIDDSGYIELSELVHFGAAVGAGWTPAACEKLLGCMDTSGDRKISMSEFEAFMREVGLHCCHDEVEAFIKVCSAFSSQVRRSLSSTEEDVLNVDSEEDPTGVQSI
ncbi:MAG: hypothetical protein SGPRY_001909 [Prymnesium sp.]